jgi:hypothetical protein
MRWGTWAPSKDNFAEPMRKSAAATETKIPSIMIPNRMRRVIFWVLGNPGDRAIVITT